ncbi:MAG: hypothetical protein NC246_01370 [Muribaculaceae bacterium]|nr:hypothetical protein [Muribaculaceae bacterium]
MANESGTWVMHGVAADDPRCIHTVEEAVAYINEEGFLPLFQNEIPGFSLEERTVPEDWWTGDPKRDPWEWREIIARGGQVAYGKFFDRKAGFISREWFPYFANYRREGYDFDALWDDEKASMRQKKIMDLFADENADAELYSFEVKQNAGFGKEGEKNFEGTVTELEMKLYLCMRDFRQRRNKKGEDYGWAIAVYSTPEHLWGYDHVTSAYQESPIESWKRILERTRQICPAATESQIRRMLGISKAGSMAPRKRSGRTEPKDWIIPANPKYYDVVAAFEESRVVTWKQSSDIHVGDTIYMYVAAPYSSILYKCRAIEVDMPWQYEDENLSVKTAMTVELLEKYEPGVWSFERMKQFGVYAVRGPRSMPAELKREMEKVNFVHD